MERTLTNPDPQTSPEAPSYADQLAGFDAHEVMWGILSLARMADHIEPEIAAERVPLLLNEAIRRGYLTDPKYVDDEEFSAWLPAISDAARRSTCPAVQAILDHIRTRKSRAVRYDCALCSRPRVVEGDRWCSACSLFLMRALGEFPTFDDVTGGIPSPMIRAHGPICYLCGVELTDHAEHVIPRARGGEDRLSNLAGACRRCNLSKGDRLIEPTHDQRVRLSQQQAHLRWALDAIDQGAYWTEWLLSSWGDWIDEAVEDLSDDDPNEVERADVMFYIEQVAEDDMDAFPYMPRDLDERAVDEVLRRLGAR